MKRIVFFAFLGVAITAFGQNQKPKWMTTQELGVNGPVSVMHITEGLFEDAVSSVYRFDRDGRLTQFTVYIDPCGSYENTFYDKHGRVTRFERMLEPDCGDQVDYEKSTYREDGKPIEEVRVDGLNQVTQIMKYTYTDSGQEKKMEICNADGTVSSFNENVYDAKDRLITHSFNFGMGTDRTEYKYNDNDLVVEESYYGSDGTLQSHSLNTYDASGNKLQNQFEGYGALRVTDYAYDNNGRMIHEINHVTEDGQTSCLYEITWTYDSDGSVSVSRQDKSQVFPLSKVRMNPQGRMTHFESLTEQGQVAQKVDYWYHQNGTDLKEVQKGYYPYDEAISGDMLVETRSCDRGVDHHGNWTKETTGPLYADAFAYNGPELDWNWLVLTPIERHFAYYDEPSPHFHWEGKDGRTGCQLAYTVKDGFAMGEFQYGEQAEAFIARVVGTWNQEDQTLYLDAIEETGHVLYSLTAFVNNGFLDVTATGMIECHIQMTPKNVEEGPDRDYIADAYCSPFWKYKNYFFEPYLNDIAGIYTYSYDDQSYGKIMISRTGRDLNTILFTIEITGTGPDFNTGMVEGSAVLDGNRFRYSLPDYDYTFEVTFYDGYLRIKGIEGSLWGYFGMGVTLEHVFIQMQAEG